MNFFLDRCHRSKIVFDLLLHAIEIFSCQLIDPFYNYAETFVL